MSSAYVVVVFRLVTCSRCARQYYGNPTLDLSWREGVLVLSPKNYVIAPEDRRALTQKPRTAVDLYTCASHSNPHDEAGRQYEVCTYRDRQR